MPTKDPLSKQFYNKLGDQVSYLVDRKWQRKVVPELQAAFPQCVFHWTATSDPSCTVVVLGDADLHQVTSVIGSPTDVSSVPDFGALEEWLDTQEKCGDYSAVALERARLCLADQRVYWTSARTADRLTETRIRQIPLSYLYRLETACNESPYDIVEYPRILEEIVYKRWVGGLRLIVNLVECRANGRTPPSGVSVRAAIEDDPTNAWCYVASVLHDGDIHEAMRLARWCITMHSEPTHIARVCQLSVLAFIGGLASVEDQVTSPYKNFWKDCI